MSAETVPHPRPDLVALPAPTGSLIYPDWDWAEATALELTIEHKHLTASTAYPEDTLRLELARIAGAARQKGVTL